jgi:alcohol dehydrogenase class IV
VTGPHDVPDVGQLVEAVREWLERDVMSSDDARLRFHSRVAVNILAMVERELQLGPDHEIAHRRRLERLGVVDDRELASKIRAGDFDSEAEVLRELLRAAVDDKLAVANPRYLAD